MKKLLKVALCFIVCVNIVFAAQSQHIASNLNFDAISWTSGNTNDLVTIEGPVDSTFSFAVQISPQRDQYNTYSTGINVRNCGSVTHINAGSTAICFLTNKNPVIIFSSDSDKENLSAFGFYQIEKNL